jgi:aspartate carbamoyltransferase catalytic subunit
MEWTRKDLLTLEELSIEEMQLILDTAVSFKEVITQREIKKVPTLRGKTIVNLFYEPSTRTRTSFELAAKRLSADVVNIATQTSSVVKGETLLDTVRTLEAMKIDLMIMRHPNSGAPALAAQNLKAAVINAGDGRHEHPTQGLLDIFTMRDKKKDLRGLKVAIVGDVMHSRVARSNLWGLLKFGAEVRMIGPATLVPDAMRALGAKVYNNLKDGLEGVDVINVLRLQLERQQKGLFPTVREYVTLYGINRQTVKYAKEDCIVMHPGPMNRGIEISSEIADGPSSVINEQVTNGVAVRMAVLFLLGGGKPMERPGVEQAQEITQPS